MSSWKTPGVPGRRLPLLALVVAVLVAVVALVAHGRPLASGAGHGGLSASFWDYTLTTAIIAGALGALALVTVLAAGVPGGKKFTPPPHTRALMVIPALAGFVAIAFALRHFLHLRHGAFGGDTPNGAGGVETAVPSTSPSTPLRFRWEEAIPVLGLLLLVGMILFTTTRRRGRPNWGKLGAPEALAAALDESLDDLRADPDLRRAIIAAYARMETALGAAGVPRRAAEAPLEYLERALLKLDLSRGSVHRLTDLFEGARFSHHEPEASMRDEAVEALEAVRDELRAPAELAA
ncbi:MAG: hypothetical protein QOG85_2181 [Gaiellaceae bacterium]|jgi:hypothetical protein|nr:hypothetical protein [Gaiellaceae bacterium]